MIVSTELSQCADQVLGFRAALYFAAGISVLGLILDVLFVRVVKDDREGWNKTETGRRDWDQVGEIPGRGGVRGRDGGRHSYIRRGKVTNPVWIGWGRYAR